ncbi:Nuclear actin-protein involved in chromatin remodeling, partial [Coemansia sp. RSA 2618]
MTEGDVYEIPDGPPDPSPAMPSFDFTTMGHGSVPLVIDNGSGTCRAGWATEQDPRLEFESIVAKYRNRKVSAGPIMLIGSNVHSDPMAKSSIRSAFDGGVVTNFDAMEGILDYVFTMLGCVDDKLDQPIVMTEAVCTPYTSRRNMSELLFECYNVPSVSYGIDSVWSYYKNTGSLSNDGLVIGSGTVASHIIPIYDARAQTEHCKRINLGGQSMEEYMLKLLQLKYPTFPMKITEWQSQNLIQHSAYMAEDYEKELSCYLTADNLGRKDITVQFPFPMPSVDERTEEDIQRATERRREQAKKMQEVAAKKRQEKVEKRAKELEELSEIRDSKAELDADEFAMRLKEAGLKGERDLEEAIASAQQVVTRAQNKELGIEPEEKEAPTFPLADIPDEELTDEQKQEKRKQVLLRASHEARERARVERDKEKARQEELAKQDEERRLNHFDEWLADLKAQRDGVIARMEERHTLRKELNDRRSHASQVRMRNIADLAATEATNSAGNKRRRRGDQDDDFGAEDADWNIYRDISKEEEADEDEEDEAEIEKYNKQMALHAPDYLESLDRDARSKIENTTMYRFTEGCQPAILEKTAAPLKLDNAAIIARAAREYQLHLNVERIRVPEIIFRPSLVGLDQAGLLETIDGIVRQTGNRLSLVNNVFVTGGGFSGAAGILERLQKDIRSIVPAGTPIAVRRAADPLRDAWRGAALWSMNEGEAFKASCITRQDYLEYGGEYLREHALLAVVAAAASAKGNSAFETDVAHYVLDDSSYSYCNPRYPSAQSYSPLPGAKLELVQAVVRHGDRPPVHYISNDDSTWRCDEVEQEAYLHGAGESETNTTGSFRQVIAIPEWNHKYGFSNQFWKGSCEEGELTDRGKRQHNILGTQLRNIYVDKLGYLSPELNSADEVYLRTTHIWRTKNSAQSLLGALWPKRGITPKAAIPLHTYPKRIETMYGNTDMCPQINTILAQIVGGEGYQKFLQDQGPLMARLSDIMDVHGSNWADSWDGFFDVLNARQCHGIDLPCKYIDGVKNSTQCATAADVTQVSHNANYEWAYKFRDSPQAQNLTRLYIGSFV